MVALVALVNLGLVLFDVSYIRFRDLYFRYLPQLTQAYDTIKGIEPYRDTDQYLAVVDQLEGMIAQQGINGSQVSPLLKDLQDRSVNMIQEDPFRVANKSGNLEKLKNRMRQHMQLKSAKGAFQAFWSLEHLNQQNWQTELAFFNQDFRPIMAANYFRPIDESGDFVDRFWIIDVWFVGLFAVDLLLRVVWIRQRYRTGWKDAVLWRWYDLLLLLPVWRFVRIVPVAIRLHQAGLINLQNIRDQVNRNLAENIAAEVTELVLIQAFSAAQGGIKQGVLRQWLASSASLINPRMADANGIDELKVLSHRLVDAIQVALPKTQPEIEALVRHGVGQAIAQIPFHQTFQTLPGLNQLSEELTKQVASQLVQTLSSGLRSGIADEVSPQLVQQLAQHFFEHLQTELTQTESLAEIETLLVEWIEDLKLTLLQSFETNGQQQIVNAAEIARRLRDTSPATVLPQPR